MSAWYAWAKSKVSSFVTPIIKTYASVTQSLVTFFSNPKIQGSALQVWQGFNRSLNPDNLTNLVKAPETRRILYRTLTINFVVAGSMYLFNEFAFKPLYKMFSGRAEEDEESYFETSIRICILSPTLYIHLNNFILNLCISESTAKEIAGEHHLKLCDCNDLPKAVGSTYDALYGLAYAQTLEIFRRGLLGGDVITFIPAIYLSGRSLFAFLEGCTKHRNEEIKKNNLYIYGLGVSVKTWEILLNSLLERTLGVSYLGLGVAVSAIVYQYHVLVINGVDHLPGKEVGVDFLKYPRILTDEINKDLFAVFVPLAGKIVGKINSNEKLEQRLVGLLHNKQFKNYIVKNPSVEIFMDLYYPNIINKLENVEAIRDLPGFDYIPALIGLVAPLFFISEEKLALVNGAFSEKVRSLISNLRKFFILMHHQSKIRDFLYPGEVEFSAVNLELLEKSLRSNVFKLVEVMKVENFSEITTHPNDNHFFELSHINPNDFKIHPIKIEDLSNDVEVHEEIAVANEKAMLPSTPPKLSDLIQEDYMNLSTYKTRKVSVIPVSVFIPKQNKADIRQHKRSLTFQ